MKQPGTQILVALVLITMCSTRPAGAAFIVEAHESGLANQNFEFGGDTFSAMTSIPSTAVGLTATNSIFGGDGVEEPDTYVFHYRPGRDEDNFFPTAGTVLGSKDGSPGNGHKASGLTGGVTGKYNVYITSPASVNVSGVPSLITITQDGADMEIENDQNNEMTGPDSQINPARGFVGGMNNAWHLLATVQLIAGNSYSLTMQAGSNTFVSQRVHGVMWERVSGGNEPGDFDGDGAIDAVDIDLLTRAVLDRSTDLTFDVDGDGILNLADRDHWVTTVRGTWFGDANLDGEFNSTDFVLVFQRGEYEDTVDGNSGWATGDWNGDGDFDSTDFVKAFQDGGFERGPRPAAAGETAAVPEPAAAVLALAGIASILPGIRLAPNRQLREQKSR